MLYKKDDLEYFLPVTRWETNVTDSRYLRVLWLCDDVDWKALPVEYHITRAIAPFSDPSDVTCLLDVTTICWS